MQILHICYDCRIYGQAGQPCAPTGALRTPQGSKIDVHCLQDACPRLQIDDWPAQPTPEKPCKYCIYAMFVPYTASQGSHWLPVELPGHPRAGKFMFKASKMLVRSSKLVLGQPSQPLKKTVQIFNIIFEKLKGPCGHDNPSFGAFVPFVFAGCHF